MKVYSYVYRAQDPCLTCTVARAPIVSLIRSVSILFILYMVCHRRPALMGVYPPWQPVNVSFFVVIVIFVKLDK